MVYAEFESLNNVARAECDTGSAVIVCEDYKVVRGGIIATTTAQARQLRQDSGSVVVCTISDFIWRCLCDMNYISREDNRKNLVTQDFYYVAVRIDSLCTLVEKKIGYLTNPSKISQWPGFKTDNDHDYKRERELYNMYSQMTFANHYVYDIMQNYNKRTGVVDIVYTPRADYGNPLLEIRKGIERGLDITKYAKPYYNYKQMSIIRRGLESGIDMVPYVDSVYKKVVPVNIGVPITDKSCTHVAAVDLLEHILSNEDMGRRVGVYVLNNDLRIDQLNVVCKCAVIGLNVSKINKPYLSAEQMNFLMQCMIDGLDVSIMASRPYDLVDLKLFRKALTEGIDISLIAGSQYIYAQRVVLYQGLKAGIDVTQYADPSLSHEKMCVIYKQLLKGKKRHRGNSFLLRHT